MGTTFCLFACALAVAQAPPADRSEWLLVPQLSRGQELVYRGTFTEEAVGASVQLSRAYRLETRVFVLGPSAQGVQAAFMTVLKLRTSNRPEAATAPAASSVRLELARVDAQGRAVAEPGCSLLVPLEGPPTIEPGAFLEVPRGRAALGQSWEAAEAGRPPRTWRVVGTETVNSTTCLKLVGVQQSPDWDQPRADSSAWRRQDIVWLAPRAGFAYKLERTIERREPARKEPSQKSVTRYELESSLQYPGQLGDDRQREILLGRKLGDSLAPLLPKAGPVGPKPFEAILAKIKFHMETSPPTPYRAVLQQLQSRAEAGRRGESPPATMSEEVPARPILTLGRPAPDFLARDYTTNETAHLHRWLGKPILLVFYSPTSSTVEEVLRFAQSVQEAHAQQATVVALAVSDDNVRILKQRADWHLTFPILSGTGLRLSYALETTPKLVVLDAGGVMRGSLVGWGPETARTIHDELNRWLPAAKGR